MRANGRRKRMRSIFSIPNFFCAYSNLNTSRTINQIAIWIYPESDVRAKLLLKEEKKGRRIVKRRKADHNRDEDIKSVGD